MGGGWELGSSEDQTAIPFTQRIPHRHTIPHPKSKPTQLSTLEAEFAEKLALATNLSSANEALRARERVLSRAVEIGKSEIAELKEKLESFAMEDAPAGGGGPAASGDGGGGAQVDSAVSGSGLTGGAEGEQTGGGGDSGSGAAGSVSRSATAAPDRTPSDGSSGVGRGGAGPLMNGLLSRALLTVLRMPPQLELPKEALVMMRLAYTQIFMEQGAEVRRAVDVLSTCWFAQCLRLFNFRYRPLFLSASADRAQQPSPPRFNPTTATVYEPKQALKLADSDPTREPRLAAAIESMLELQTAIKHCNARNPFAREQLRQMNLETGVKEDPPAGYWEDVVRRVRGRGKDALGRLSADKALELREAWKLRKQNAVSCWAGFWAGAAVMGYDDERVGFGLWGKD